MQIQASIPFHIARAYGVQPGAPGQPAPPGPAQVAAPATPTAPKPGELVAGTVTRAVEFDARSMPAPDAMTLQLYSRAADRVEAAVGVELGRELDVQG